MASMKIGTHNLHDTTGVATPFADMIGFTEAIPRRVKDQIRKTHKLYVCGFQRDLIIAVRRDEKIRKVVKHYRPVHGGIPLVTPHRGVFWITYERWVAGAWVREFFLVEHRINAAFPPYRRGEQWLRTRWWKKHTKISQRIITRLVEKKGRRGSGGGDVNTPAGVDGYPDAPVQEFGDHFDRLFVVLDVAEAA